MSQHKKHREKIKEPRDNTTFLFLNISKRCRGEIRFGSFFCWEKQCNTWESGHGGYKNTKVTTFLFLEIRKIPKNKMILAGSDFDENHLQSNTLIIKEVVPAYEKSKIKLRDDTAFLFLNILKRCKGQTRFRIFYWWGKYFKIKNSTV